MNTDLATLISSLNSKDYATAKAEAEKIWESGNRTIQFLPLASRAFYYGKDVVKAIEALKTWVAKQPDSPEANNQLGMINIGLGQWTEGQQLLTRAVELNPNDAIALYNLSLCHLRQAELNPTIEGWLRKAYTLKPDWPEPIIKVGMMYCLGRRSEEAITLFQEIIDKHPTSWSAYYGIGLAFENLHSYDNAQAAYGHASKLAPEQLAPFINLVRISVLNCDYAGYAPLLGRFFNAIEKQTLDVNPFLASLLTEDGAQQLGAAKSAYRDNVVPATRTTAPMAKPRAPDGKIRLGFLSDDLRNHPVGYLMAEIFELLDKSAFETIVFGYGPPVDEKPTQRIMAACTKWVDVEPLGARETAQTIADAQVDILIDLKGYTKHMRPMVYGYRPAPLQVNFLGYPGSTGGPAWDYIIADSFIVPEGFEKFYGEKILRLPGCYQPNDRNRPIGKPLTRTEYGLPDDAIVFASFNQPQKYTPHLLGIWMDILKELPTGIIWMRDYDRIPNAKRNLKAFTAAAGVNPDRLVFAPKTDGQAAHLARYAVCDMALDTGPYNSQTTCSDALWMGCPLITKPGQGFASRVAGSLLTAAGLPELVVDSWDAYKALTLQLAANKPRLAAMRQHLETNRLTFNMFDTPNYVRNLEEGFRLMHQRRLAGLAPDHITVPALPQALAA